MKFIILPTLLCLALLSSAQENQEPSLTYSNVMGGSFYINTVKNNSQSSPFSGPVVIVSGGFNSTSITETKSNSFNIAPYYGRRLSESLMVGIIGQYHTSNYKTTGYLESTVDIFGQILLPSEETISESSSDGWDISLFARYYFRPDSKIQFFIEPRLGYSKDKRDGYSVSILNGERLINDNYYERSVVGINLIPGLHYALSKRFNILVSMGFLSYQFGDETTGTIRDSRLIDIFRPSLGRVTQETDRKVSDLTLSLRMSSLNFGFEFKF